MAEPITLDIPAPADWISANDRGMWHRKARLTKEWREAAGWRARAAKVPAMQRAEIAVQLVFPVRRRRDPHNWMPTVKAAVDGLVDVGVLPDDDSTHLTVTRIDQADADRLLPPRRGILRLLITEVADGQQ